MRKLNDIITDDVLDHLNQVTGINKDKSKNESILSGYRGLDKYIKGFHNSDLIIISGRYGMGKTLFALNLALNITIKER